MTLDEITALEYEWLKKMPDRGFYRERDALFRRTGVYLAWRRIFREYVMLAKTGDKEALKRAIFLYWYSFSEPRELSGIPDLDKDLAREVFSLADNMLQMPECDAELKWMLPYYYSVADFYIAGFGPDQFGNLRRASKENTNLYRSLCLESTFENRGQLGKYWESIQKNAAKWGPDGPSPTTERQEEVRKIISSYLNSGVSSWLRSRIDTVRGPLTVAAVQKEFAGANRRLENASGWKQLEAKLRQSDEFYFYETDRQSWDALRGRRGYMVIRGNEVIGDLLTLMN